jgi:hypothetical protein
LSEFANESDGFYDGEDEKALLAAVRANEPHVGCIVGFATDSFFAKRGGKLLAKVIDIAEPDGPDRGYIHVKCLPGTDCYLSPGETESFPFTGWEKLLEVKQPPEDKE